MSRITLDIDGIESVIKRLEGAQAALRRGVSAGVRAVGENIRTSSMRRVPVDLGVLRASHYVTEPEMDGGEVHVVVGCGGGPAKPYAIVQHERLDYRHGEGEAKFLENASREEAPRAADLIARFAKASLAGGGSGS